MNSQQRRPEELVTDMTQVDLPSLEQWVGKKEVLTDTVTPLPVAGLSAALDDSTAIAAEGTPLPKLRHWLYFLPMVAASGLDTDGHPERGGFLPPVPLPRRMWASSKIGFESNLMIGDEIKRVSTIRDISLKTGSTGQLVFVTVAHDIFSHEKLAIRELQSIVYRDTATKSAPSLAKPAPAVSMWSRIIKPDPMLLFRYSALTFNSHRIHYDRDFALRREGYDGLVVQAPLVATLLLDLLYREHPDVQVSGFEFRGVRPLFDHDVIHLHGRQDGQIITLWALNEAGALTMTANAGLVSTEPSD